MELLDQLEAENPEDPALAPKVCWHVKPGDLGQPEPLGGLRKPAGSGHRSRDRARGRCPAPSTPQDLSEWACIYIKYIQILRKLETAYDQMVHPQ